MKDGYKFNIKFIGLIQARPCLYDQTRPDYINRDIQGIAWQEISTIVNEEVTLCKERWKNIRGRYTKYLKAGTTTKFVKPYYLANRLRFLYPFTKSRQPKTNTKIPSPDEDIADKFQEIIDSESDHTEQEGQSCAKARPSIKKRNPSTFKPLNESSEKAADDPDLCFLKSILPDMKKMNDDQKRKFKIGLLNLAGQVLEGGSNEEGYFSPANDTINSVYMKADVETQESTDYIY